MDEEFERAVPEYWKHIARIADRLPVHVLDLAANTSLHDGRFQQVVIDSHSRICAIDLRCGDLQRGYFDLRLNYFDATIDVYEGTNLAAIIDVSASEILSDEIDIGERRPFVHRLLCWPSGEIHIGFTDVSIVRSKVPDREFVSLTPGLAQLPKQEE